MLHRPWHDQEIAFCEFDCPVTKVDRDPRRACAMLEAGGAMASVPRFTVICGGVALSGAEWRLETGARAARSPRKGLALKRCAASPVAHGAI